MLLSFFSHGTCLRALLMQITSDLLMQAATRTHRSRCSGLIEFQRNLCNQGDLWHSFRILSQSFTIYFAPSLAVCSVRTDEHRRAGSCAHATMHPHVAIHPCTHALPVLILCRACPRRQSLVRSPNTPALHSPPFTGKLCLIFLVQLWQGYWLGNCCISAKPDC